MLEASRKELKITREHVRICTMRPERRGTPVESERDRMKGQGTGHSSGLSGSGSIATPSPIGCSREGLILVHVKHYGWATVRRHAGRVPCDPTRPQLRCVDLR